MSPITLTTTEAAQVLGTSREQVCRLIRSGRLYAGRSGDHGRHQISYASLEGYLVAREECGSDGMASERARARIDVVLRGRVRRAQAPGQLSLDEEVPA